MNKSTEIMLPFGFSLSRRRFRMTKTIVYTIIVLYIALKLVILFRKWRRLGIKTLLFRVAQMLPSVKAKCDKECKKFEDTFHDLYAK